jgi:hypothetical protein
MTTHAQHSTAKKNKKNKNLLIPHTSSKQCFDDLVILTKGIMILKDVTGVVDVIWKRFGRQNNSEQQNVLPTSLYNASP